MLCNEDDPFNMAHTVAEAMAEDRIYSEIKRLVARQDAIAKRLSDGLEAIAAEKSREQPE